MKKEKSGKHFVKNENKTFNKDLEQDFGQKFL
jgi:hypothetical protein